MWRRDWTPIILLILVLAVQTSYALECRGTRCRTEECDENGECICKLPDPSTILDGDRLYLGGKLCDEEQVMCDGTNSFWCEHGGRCNEIIQGENYTCDCPPGFIGEHCEHSGAPCGNMFCFHQGECMKEDSLCDCPSNWRGSANCSLQQKLAPIKIVQCECQFDPICKGDNVSGNCYKWRGDTIQAGIMPAEPLFEWCMKPFAAEPLLEWCMKHLQS